MVKAKLLLADSIFEKQDDYTVVLKLQNAVTDVLDVMAGRGQFPAIMPAEIIASASSDGVSEYIGTGHLNSLIGSKTVSSILQNSMTTRLLKVSQTE